MRDQRPERGPDKGARNHFEQIGRCMGRPLVQGPTTGYVVPQMASTRQEVEL